MSTHSIRHEPLVKAIEDTACKIREVGYNNLTEEEKDFCRTFIILDYFDENGTLGTEYYSLIEAINNTTNL